MIKVQDAFKKFRSRLELTQKEQDDASRRQSEIRGVMQEDFDVEHDFLTGSYRRWTKTKPLKDVDIFCVLGQKERHYRDKVPDELLKAVEKTLAKKYGSSCVRRQRRSVSVDFGIREDENGETGERVMSFDVVPAFTKDDYYEIPDTATSSGWTKTNPRIHYDKAVAANDAYDGKWKGLVRMMKSWNREHGKPIRPSFLIEVMALEVLYPPWGGVYSREMQAFFHTLADRVREDWPEPAGLGPDVSDQMDAAARESARQALLAAERQAADAIRMEREGRIGDALRAWRALFGKLFPLS
ncbi:MAG: nucleotidyltransferase [Acidobacteriota bacterium]|nr:nucleotidyltransferase [Acidobacteriota bacterium]